MTIRNQLILWYSGLLALILIVFGVGMFAIARWTLVNSVDDALWGTVQQIVQNMTATRYGEFGGPVSIRISVPEIDVFRASGVHVQVWQAGSRGFTLLRTSSNLGGYAQPIDPVSLEREGRRVFENNDEVGGLSSDVNINGTQWRVLTRPLNLWGIRVIMQAAMPLDTVNQASRGLLAILAFSLVFALLGSMAVGFSLSNRALKPIDAITQAASRIASTDDLSTRLPWSGPMDELGRMISVFNLMMARLEHLFNVQKRFVADVSHELRTPLTAIRGHLDLIKRYGMDEESLQAAESEVARMSRLVSDLLLLAKADYGGLTLNLEPLDLDTVVSETYREARVLIRDRDLKMRIEEFEPVRINGDADRLKQLLLNLISNAIKFTPDGGEIVLNLRKNLRTAELEVQDTGIGIAKEDLQRVFDRFYQTDSSRARDVRGDGSGLGLSIAKWIAEAHQGQITVESEVGVGTTFRVTIPHLEDQTTVTSEQMTRPRLRLLRRNSLASPQKTKT
ncbi:MAG TPA: HAMP domain-containing sensor histidine kinase [Oceanobacillus sp.]|nr:HAMP domain-containing sensor histidine kinase [Oceanobacillus sp.]